MEVGGRSIKGRCSDYRMEHLPSFEPVAPETVERERSRAMNYTTKTCPHCQAQLQPSEGAFELVRRGMAGSESPPGLPVSLYSCP